MPKFDKTICAYCVEPLNAGDHSNCLSRLQTGTPKDRADPWTASTISMIKKNVRRLEKRRKVCPVDGVVFTRKGKYCSPSCTSKAYRLRKAGKSIDSGGPPRKRQASVKGTGVRYVKHGTYYCPSNRTHKDPAVQKLHAAAVAAKGV